MTSLLDTKSLLEAEQRARRRAERMQELSMAIAGTVRRDEVVEIVMEHGVTSTGAYAGVIALLAEDGAGLEAVGSVGYDPCIQPGRRWSITAPIPLAEAVRTRAPVVVESPDAWRGHFGSEPPRSRSAAWAAFPLLLGAEAPPVGAILWTFDAAREFTSDARDHLAALARLSAQALERARLHEAELNARHAAERALDRLGRLQALTSRLSEALTPPEVAEVVVNQGLNALGASAGSLALASPDEQFLELLGAVGYPPDQVERFRRFPIDLAFPLSDTYRRGEPIILATAAERDEHYPHLAELRRANGSGPMAAVPLVVNGRRLGAIGLNFPAGVDIHADDRAFLLALADQCAQALERARLFEAERRARAEAEAANRVKAEFLANMSHELRTPLNAIAGYAELLELGVHGELAPEQRGALERIRRNQRHLLSLINDVLNFARIEAGHLEVHPRAVAVAELLSDLEALLGPQFRVKGLGVRVDPGPPGLTLWADPEKTRQVLLNLVSNAVKFTPAEGEVTLTAELAGNTVRLEVRDTGIGIPADKLEAIFEPFVQLDRTLTSAHQGTGLGLAISRDLARAMGGELTASSELSKGSTFVLTLPTPAP